MTEMHVWAAQSPDESRIRVQTEPLGPGDLPGWERRHGVVIREDFERDFYGVLEPADVERAHRLLWAGLAPAD